MNEPGFGQAKPLTHLIDVERAGTTLSHHEMLALAKLYARWALEEPNIDGNQRTKLIQWSSDYESIATYYGRAWIASDPDPADPIAFVARFAMRRDETLLPYNEE